VTLRKVVLTATTSGYTIAASMANSVRVNGSVKAVTSAFVSTASTYTIDFGASTQEVISAGSSKTFEILATISGAPANGSITSKIEEDAAYATDGTGNFVWSDGADISSDTYSNGKRVSGLTTVTQSLTK
jgi:hypothetical protein